MPTVAEQLKMEAILAVLAYGQELWRIRYVGMTVEKNAAVAAFEVNDAVMHRIRAGLTTFTDQIDRLGAQPDEIPMILGALGTICNLPTNEQFTSRSADANSLDI